MKEGTGQNGCHGYLSFHYKVHRLGERGERDVFQVPFKAGMLVACESSDE